MENQRILAINPGSTSTKIAVYQGSKSIFLKNIKHSAEDLKSFKSVVDQFSFRKKIILKELKDAEIRIDLITAIVGRGGLVKPIESGVYEVNEAMLKDLHESKLGEHASNLGGLIAHDIAQSLEGARAFIADPVVVDEMEDVARYTGHPEFVRHSIFHALNQKAIAIKYAKSVDKPYEELNLIVAHLGGGISVGAHRKGRVIDVNNALDGDGPFSPERVGTLPCGQVAQLCFSKKYTHEQVKKMINGEGGYVSYLGTNDGYEVEMKIKAGDEESKKIHDAVGYQIGKEIGSLSTVLKGEVDAILFTGGMAYDKSLIDYIKEMVDFIAPIMVYPGEDEMEALAMNGYSVMKGEVEPKIYK
ncbi:MAG: butyrate kinase [Bacteroidales bacterium]|jgi:butyrate kinase|nr:butyrate kinase [Bacteroidales bacterium]